eukprot:1009099-Amphidinium_carterae.1
MADPTPQKSEQQLVLAVFTPDRNYFPLGSKAICTSDQGSVSLGSPNGSGSILFDPDRTKHNPLIRHSLVIPQKLGVRRSVWGVITT